MTAPEAARRRRVVSSLVGLAVSIALLWWAVRGVRFSEIVVHLRAANPLRLAAAVALATLTFAVRAIRWRWLLPDQAGRVPAAARWHAVAIGFMANNLLPLRAGEIIRCYVLTRLAPVRFSTALSSVVVERVFDGITLIGLLAVGLFAAHLPADLAVGGVSIARAATGAGLVCLAALAVAIAILAAPVAAERVSRRLIPSPALADRVVGMIEGIRGGLHALASPGRLVAVIGWSLAHWLLNAAAFYVAFGALGIQVGYAGALLMQSVLAFGIAVPSTPGFIGPFEAVIVAVLAVFGVPRAEAFSYALAYHVTTFVPITALGLLSLSRTAIGFRELERSAST